MRGGDAGDLRVLVARRDLYDVGADQVEPRERPPHADQSWYVVLAPYPNPRIVTAVTMEEGGFGVEAAAPAALQILESYFNKHATAVSGSSSGAE